ncbi:MAG TPA: YgcG family protein [Rhizomicrobium sp.]|nr:YgcG family protein [Rhizomicrobium sp.]
MRLLAAVFAFLCLILPATAAPDSPATPNFPKLTGRVVDDANILSQTTRDDLTQKLAALEQKTSRQLVVVTIPSLQGYEISDYGYQLGRAWGIGQAKLNNGILLIVAPTEHKVRIEVGYGLEPIVTDALSEVIIQTQILPKFRGGDFNGGVEAGVDALVQQLSLDTSDAEKRAAAAEQHQPQGDQGGGGLGGFIILLFIFIAIFRVFGGWGLLPFLFMGGGRGGGWGGGGGWSGGSGGGWSGGGGGSFGGGGASGSW